MVKLAVRVYSVMTITYGLLLVLAAWGAPLGFKWLKQDDATWITFGIAGLLSVPFVITYTKLGLNSDDQPPSQETKERHEQLRQACPIWHVAWYTCIGSAVVAVIANALGFQEVNPFFAFSGGVSLLTGIWFLIVNPIAVSLFSQNGEQDESVLSGGQVGPFSGASVAETLKTAMRLSTTELAELPPYLRGPVEGELHPNESILWIGQPVTRRFAMRSLPMAMFGIQWTVVLICWMAFCSGFQMPDFPDSKVATVFLMLFGISLLLPGVVMVCSPLWMMGKAKSTAYVLTNYRALIIANWFSKTVRSFGPHRLNDIWQTESPDGSGDLIFELKPRCAAAQSGGFYLFGTQFIDIGLLAIADVKSVEALVRDLVAGCPDHEAVSAVNSNAGQRVV